MMFLDSYRQGGVGVLLDEGPARAELRRLSQTFGI